MPSSSIRLSWVSVVEQGTGAACVGRLVTAVALALPAGLQAQRVPVALQAQAAQRVPVASEAELAGPVLAVPEASRVKLAQPVLRVPLVLQAKAVLRAWQVRAVQRGRRAVLGPRALVA